MSDKEFLTRYDNGEKFTEEELSNMLYEFYVIHEDKDPDIYKCHQSVTTVFNINNRLFALYWVEDHGKYQEHEFFEQPHEVKEVKKMIEVIEYERV